MKKQPTQMSSYEEAPQEPIQVSYRPRAGTYEADLHGYIHSPSQFSNIITALGIMEEQDEFVLNLQSGGGSLDVTDSLIHAMRKCQGHIHVVACGNVSSAATFVLLEADSFELSEGFNALLHSGSVGSGGTYSEYRQQTAFYNKFMESTLRKAYTGFLTTLELDAMLDGRDIILDAEQWAERYEKRNEYFKAMMEEIQDEEHSCGNSCTDCSCKSQQIPEEEFISIQTVSEEKPRKIRLKKAPAKVNPLNTIAQ